MDVQSARDDDRRATSWRAAFVVALAGLAVWQWTRGEESLLDPDAKPRAETPRGDLESGEQATIALFERASPSVVFIRNVAGGTLTRALIPTEAREGTGSGFAWDDSGHVVTNYHVIHDADEIEVTTADHRTWTAQLVGFEVEKDIAVLEVRAPAGALPPLAVGNSAGLRVGQDVFAIGNPFGLDQTLTTGIISGLGREMPAKYRESERGQRLLTDLIQTQAPINPGNSGGPLLDSAGRLIGMNTAIVSPSGASAGIGFAIPVDTINRIVTEILRYGHAIRPSLGVRILDAAGVRGAIVTEVIPGSGAERAGLRGVDVNRFSRIVDLVANCDLIVAIDDAPVRGSADLFRALANVEVGDSVRLNVRRGGSPIAVEVELKDLRQ
jgi:S1-C subfamily serine protease